MCILLQESGLKVNHPASFAVRLNGAQGKMEAKVHSPSGALDECVVTELEKGLCSYSGWIFHRLVSFFYSQTQLYVCNNIYLLCLQTSTQSGSFPGRTASILLMSSSTAPTSQEVLSRSESGSRDRPEMPVWSQHMELDWREARQVGYNSFTGTAVLI